MRLEEEAKARRNIADTIETTEGSLIFLRDDKLLRPYDSPHLDSYPEDGKERADKNLVYWALARESYIGFAYNKTLVPKDAVPKNFDGLFHPQLKGKMGISIGQTSDKIIGAMIKTKGEEFVRKLKAQEIKLYSIDAPALVNNIASGEIVASPAIFQTHTLLAASKGAPVEWVPMDLVPTNVGSAAIAANPPHPHAALFMADFLLSPDGQGSAGKILLRQRRQGLWLQEMAPGAWFDDRPVREGAGALGQTVEFDHTQVEETFHREGTKDTKFRNRFRPSELHVRVRASIFTLVT